MSSFSYNRHLLHTEKKKYLKIRRNICAIPTAERKRFISINKLCKCRDKRKIKKKSGRTAEKTKKVSIQSQKWGRHFKCFHFYLIPVKVAKCKATRIQGVYATPKKTRQFHRQNKGNMTNLAANDKAPFAAWLVCNDEVI